MPRATDSDRRFWLCEERDASCGVSAEKVNQMRITVIVAMFMLLVACAAGPDTRSTRSQSSVPLTDSEKTYLARLESDGRLMYEKDSRAAEATDILLGIIDPADYPGFVGWVTLPNGEDYTVSFYEKLGSEFSIIADVKFETQANYSIDMHPERSLSEREESMIRARIAALEGGVSACSERFNTIVIPSQNEGAWDVYLIAATTNPDLVLVGGHIKVTVSKFDAEILDRKPLSKSCLTFDKSGGDMPEGASMAAFFMTHIVTPMPVEVHPYLSLLHGANLAVSTERGLWMIESGGINLIR